MRLYLMYFFEILQLNHEPLHTNNRLRGRVHTVPRDETYV